MAGFMDFFDTDQARLGMGLLAAAGPRADGAGFGQRLMEGVGSLDKWKQDKQRAQYIKAQMEEQSAQADQRRAKAAQEQALLEQDARKRAALPGLFSQGSAGAPAFNVDDALPSFMRTGSAPQPAVAPRRAGIDVQGALSAGYTADEITKLDGLRNIGQDEVARTVKGIGPDGREYEYQVDKYGRKKDEGLAQWKAPVFNDGGGQTNVIDPYNPLKPIGSLPKTMTFSDKNAAATLNLSRERFNSEQTKESKPTFNADAGGFIYPPDMKNPSGRVVPVDGFKKPLNDSQSKAYLFGTRMQEAEDVITEAAKGPKGADRPGYLKRTAEATVGLVPFAGDKLSSVAGSALNWTQSDTQQQVEQAQDNFLNAVLRRESGAVIGADEKANAARQYFPQVGDSDARLAQKARNRQTAINGVMSDVPDAYKAKSPILNVPKPSIPMPDDVGSIVQFYTGGKK